MASQPSGKQGDRRGTEWRPKPLKLGTLWFIQKRKHKLRFCLLTAHCELEYYSRQEDSKERNNKKTLKQLHTCNIEIHPPPPTKEGGDLWLFTLKLQDGRSQTLGTENEQERLNWVLEILKLRGIQQIISLLSDPALSYYAAFALANLTLASDEKKVAIVRYGGIVPLTSFLTSSSDQKLHDCIYYALCKISQNTEIREELGRHVFQPILPLLDGDNMRWKDFALQTINNCTTTPGNRIRVRESGGLQKVLSLFATFAEPSANSKDKERDEKFRKNIVAIISHCSHDEASIPLLADTVPILLKFFSEFPDLREHIVVAVSNIARSVQDPERQKSIYDAISTKLSSQPLMEALIESTSVPSDDDEDAHKLYEAAIYLVSILAGDPQNHDCMLQCNAVAKLVRALSKKEERRSLYALTTLNYLSQKKDYATEFLKLYGFSSILEFLSSSPQLQKLAVSVMLNLVVNDAVKRHLGANTYSLNLLLKCLMSSFEKNNDEVLVNVLSLLASIAENDLARVQLCRTPCTQYLLHLLGTDKDDVIYNAMLCLERCSHSAQTKNDIGEAGLKTLLRFAGGADVRFQEISARIIANCASDGKLATVLRNQRGIDDILRLLTAVQSQRALAELLRALRNVAYYEENASIILQQGVNDILAILSTATSDTIIDFCAKTLRNCVATQPKHTGPLAAAGGLSAALAALPKCSSNGVQLECMRLVQLLTSRDPSAAAVTVSSAAPAAVDALLAVLRQNLAVLTNPSQVGSADDTTPSQSGKAVDTAHNVVDNVIATLHNVVATPHTAAAATLSTHVVCGGGVSLLVDSVVCGRSEGRQRAAADVIRACVEPLAANQVALATSGELRQLLLRLPVLSTSTHPIALEAALVAVNTCAKNSATKQPIAEGANHLLSLLEFPNAEVQDLAAKALIHSALNDNNEIEITNMAGLLSLTALFTDPSVKAKRTARWVFKLENNELQIHVDIPSPILSFRFDTAEISRKYAARAMAACHFRQPPRKPANSQKTPHNVRRPNSDSTVASNLVSTLSTSAELATPGTSTWHVGHPSVAEPEKENSATEDDEDDTSSSSSSSSSSSFDRNAANEPSTMSTPPAGAAAAAAATKQSRRLINKDAKLMRRYVSARQLNATTHLLRTQFTKYSKYEAQVGDYLSTAVLRDRDPPEDSPREAAGVSTLATTAGPTAWEEHRGNAAIIGSTRLVAENVIAARGIGCVRADRPITREATWAYFEVYVMSSSQSESGVVVGLGPRDLVLPATDSLSDSGRMNVIDSELGGCLYYGYRARDGYRIRRLSPNTSSNAASAPANPGTGSGSVPTLDGSASEFGPPFGAGDVVGVGYHNITKDVFFTRNGLFIATAFGSAAEDPALLYPVVVLCRHGDKVYANFGQAPFVFDFDFEFSLNSLSPSPVLPIQAAPTPTLTRTLSATNIVTVATPPPAPAIDNASTTPAVMHNRPHAGSAKRLAKRLRRAPVVVARDAVMHFVETTLHLRLDELVDTTESSTAVTPVSPLTRHGSGGSLPLPRDANQLKTRPKRANSDLSLSAQRLAALQAISTSTPSMSPPGSPRTTRTMTVARPPGPVLSKSETSLSKSTPTVGVASADTVNGGGDSVTVTIHSAAASQPQTVAVATAAAPNAPSTSQTAEPGICDGCGARLTALPWYRCAACENFHFCSECLEAPRAHPRGHVFIAVYEPIAANHAREQWRYKPVKYSESTVHVGKRCRGCQAEPILGTRYVRLQTPIGSDGAMATKSAEPYDVCALCQANSAHERHNYLRLPFAIEGELTHR